MRYIIMADGKGTRWDNYNDIPKHLIKFNGETLLERTVRLIHERDKDSEVIITSHDERYEVNNARRYEPKNNILEIDRFTKELIIDDCCFLYGDTFYSEESMDTIMREDSDTLLFFGNEKSIVAIKVRDAKSFNKHIDIVTKLFKEGKIKTCKGWQVYQSFAGLPFDEKVIGKDYVLIKDDTRDFNTPKDLL